MRVIFWPGLDWWPPLASQEAWRGSHAPGKEGGRGQRFSHHKNWDVVMVDGLCWGNMFCWGAFVPLIASELCDSIFASRRIFVTLGVFVFATFFIHRTRRMNRYPKKIWWIPCPLPAGWFSWSFGVSPMEQPSHRGLGDIFWIWRATYRSR